MSLSLLPKRWAWVAFGLVIAASGCVPDGDTKAKPAERSTEKRESRLSLDAPPEVVKLEGLLRRAAPYEEAMYKSAAKIGEDVDAATEGHAKAKTLKDLATLAQSVSKKLIDGQAEFDQHCANYRRAMEDIPATYDEVSSYYLKTAEQEGEPHHKAIYEEMAEGARLQGARMRTRQEKLRQLADDLRAATVRLMKAQRLLNHVSDHAETHSGASPDDSNLTDMKARLEGFFEVIRRFKDPIGKHNQKIRELSMMRSRWSDEGRKLVAQYDDRAAEEKRAEEERLAAIERKKVMEREMAKEAERQRQARLNAEGIERIKAMMAAKEKEERERQARQEKTRQAEERQRAVTAEARQEDNGLPHGPPPAFGSTPTEKAYVAKNGATSLKYPYVVTPAKEAP